MKAADWIQLAAVIIRAVAAIVAEFATIAAWRAAAVVVEQDVVLKGELGLRQSRTAFYRLLPRLIRRPGAKDPDHEYVADNAVDRHRRDRRYAPAGLIEYLDAGVR